MRHLTHQEIETLRQQVCSAEDWNDILVSPDFATKRVWRVRFSGHVQIGSLEGRFTLPGGIIRKAGIFGVALHNVTVGDGCLIENVESGIANYDIGHHCLITGVESIVTEGESRFGNGAEAAVMNETGGREVAIHEQLSAQLAYMMAFYRYRPQLTQRLQQLTADHIAQYVSSRGRIGDHVTIRHAGTILNVNIGSGATLHGCCRLTDGSIVSNADAPVHVGHGVVADHFIIHSGSHVDDGTMLTNCFVGQACRLGHNYSASDSLFFSNCQGENGEACAIFAGPFTVTHHKSTLLIAGMFSFMNAGSGSNQSNHMYKLGPIHQGILERGAKTTSDSYILWPARVGAFSLVMGRHTGHMDTTNMPFSYLIEKNNTTYLVPGVNLRSVGTIRDALKWPKRDGRTDAHQLDKINFNLLSPFMIQKMMRGTDILEQLQQTSGMLSEEYAFHSARIRNSSLKKGLRFYSMAMHKFMGNSVIKRLETLKPLIKTGLTDAEVLAARREHDAEIRNLLRPTTKIGTGEWVDISGLIAPKSEIDRLIERIEQGDITSIETINAEFDRMHLSYYDYEWTWVYDHLQSFYGIRPEEITAQDVVRIVEQWQDAVVTLDRMVYEDARKEFSLASMTGFGADGTKLEKQTDFEQVRGAFDTDPFVTAVLQHIDIKTALGQNLLARLS